MKILTSQISKCDYRLLEFFDMELSLRVKYLNFCNSILMTIHVFVVMTIQIDYSSHLWRLGQYHESCKSSKTQVKKTAMLFASIPSLCLLFLSFYCFPTSPYLSFLFCLFRIVKSDQNCQKYPIGSGFLNQEKCRISFKLWNHIHPFRVMSATVFVFVFSLLMSCVLVSHRAA